MELRGEGLALGVDAQWPFREYNHIGWANGQIILIGTDGLWETENPEGESFGKDRVYDIIRRHRNASSQRVLQALTEALAAFRQNASQEDDVTLVVIKTLPPET
jgi:sigma-B regulation protein RsbU (phosphoserine phosphatase)